MKPISYYVDTLETRALMETYGSSLEHISFESKVLMLALLSNSIAFSYPVSRQIEREDGYSSIETFVRVVMQKFDESHSIAEKLDLIRAIAESMAIEGEGL